jgi:hypothetical protein
MDATGPYDSVAFWKQPGWLENRREEQRLAALEPYVDPRKADEEASRNAGLIMAGGWVLFVLFYPKYRIDAGIVAGTTAVFYYAYS